MTKTVVVYQSHYGTTEKYAQWIAEDSKADLFKVSDITTETLLTYDTIVYCGGLYAGGILGFPIIKKNFSRLTNKNIIAVAVGATLKKAEDIEAVKNKNLTPEMRDAVCFFMLRGGLNYKKMSLLHKAMMFLLVTFLKFKKSDKLDNDSKGLIATYGKVVNFTDKDTIGPIINEIQNLTSASSNKINK